MKHTLKNKIYNAFLFGFAITLLTSAVIVFGFSLPSIYNSNIKTEHETTIQTSKQIDNYLNQIKALCSQVSYTEATRNILSKKYSGDIDHAVEYIQDTAEMFQLYANFLFPYEGAYGIFIYNQNGYPYYYCPAAFTNRTPYIRNEDWYLELEQTDDYGHFVISDIHQPKQSFNNNSYFISIYRNIYDIMSFETVGQAEILIHPSIFQSILATSAKEPEKQKFILLDSQGRVIASTGGYSPGDTFDENLFKQIRSNESNESKSSFLNNMNYVTSDLSGWHLVYQYDSSILYRDIFTVVITFVSFSLLSLFAMIVWGRLLAKQITTPLALLENGVKHIQDKDFDHQIMLSSGDEFEYLADTFNQMTNTLKAYIEQIREVENQKTKAQLNALQAQINPHFTLNTINSIKHMAMLQNQNNIVSILNDFSLLLSATFRFPNELVTLREEVDRIRAFVRIQDATSFGKIKLQLSYDEEVLDYLSLGLILQPIVENSIFHGIKPKMSSHQMSSGEILIQITSDDDSIIIHVIDNGIGMPQELADLLLSQTHSGIGVRNVHTRIRLRFGENYGLTIKSALHEGCTVSIHIPKITRPA